MCSRLSWLNLRQSPSNIFLQSIHSNTNDLSLTFTYLRQGLHNLHLSPLDTLGRLSARLNIELSMSLILSVDFILYVSVLPHLFSFLIGTQMFCVFLCFLLSAKIVLWTLPLTLFWWNGNHNLIHYLIPQEFLLVFCIWDHKHYV